MSRTHFFRKTHIFAEPTSFWFLAVRFRECKFHPYHLFMCAIEMVPASAHIEKSPFKLWLIPTHMNSKNTPWHPKFQPKTNGMKVLHTRWGTPWTKQDFHLKKEEPNKKHPPSTKNRVFWLQKRSLFQSLGPCPRDLPGNSCRSWDPGEGLVGWDGLQLPSFEMDSNYPIKMGLLRLQICPLCSSFGNKP